jgi:hypothetical protein
MYCVAVPLTAPASLMKLPSLTVSSLTTRRSAKLSLYIAPALAAILSAPAQATTLTRTFNGFGASTIFGTDFQPERSPTIGSVPSTVQLTATQLKMRASDALATANPYARYTFDVGSSFATLDATNGPDGVVDYNLWRFVSGTFTYDWSWSVPSAAVSQSRNLEQYVLSSLKAPNSNPGSVTTFTQLNTLIDPSGSSTATSNFVLSAAGVAGTVDRNDVFGWESAHPIGGRCASNGTGTNCIPNGTSPNFSGMSILTVSNFQFVATYESVPGPLPLAAAASGFAWSRKLRRRIKTAALSTVS